MIASKDRSGYFGASDTKFVTGNWGTKTFEKWWLEKLGLHKNNIDNEYTKAGNNYESKIIDSLDIPNIERDKQIIIGKLRVNLDSNTEDEIIEIKTYNYEKGFNLNNNYIEQVQVQMYASGIHEAKIVAYGLVANDYKNYLNEIDKSRLSFHPIMYDEDFINNKYLPRLNYLTQCLEKGTLPRIYEYRKKEEK